MSAPSGNNSSQVTWMAAAVVFSAAGMAVHTIREFGVLGLVAPETGMLPIVGVQTGLFLAWWRLPQSRRALGTTLLGTGLFQLIGGGILSVLPLPFLTFAPAQTFDHYVSHVILGLAQLPIIWIPWRLRTAQPRTTSSTTNS